MDDDEEFTVDDETDEDEWDVVNPYEMPAGLSIASFFWNLLTFTSDVVQAFDKLIRNFRTDLEVRDAKRRADKEFTSSVEAGIEKLLG